MSWEPPKDEFDCAAINGQVFTRVAFYEFIVRDADEVEKWFDAKNSTSLAAYVHSRPLPVRITQSYYAPGSGMRFVYRSNNRRPNLAPAPVDSRHWFFEGVPKNRRERMKAACTLIDKGLKHTIVARLFGYSPDHMHNYAKTAKAREMDCKAATVAVHSCA